ncbi:MAG: DUF192 domain-containing protein [Phycisphaerae bacterium]|nr:DUF192 domain-containing protein [Phycisphaerae bacterium]
MSHRWRKAAGVAASVVPLFLLATGCFGSSNGSARSSGGGAEANGISGAADAGRASTDGGEDGARASDAQRDFPLSTLPTTTVAINEHVFRVWLAQDFDPKREGVVEEGLMFVRPKEIADDQGMLFVFYGERVRGFWMRNTVTPLDIAFARMDGTIVKIWQMPPLTLQSFSSIEPAMFALEVKQGTFDRLGIKAGDRIEIPEEALYDRGRLDD